MAEQATIERPKTDETTVKHTAYVHIGAHRTGSSSFQNFLGHNRDALETAGFNLIYPARDGAEGGYGKKFNLPGPNPSEKAQNNLFQEFVKPLRKRVNNNILPDRAKTIVSEENILGRMMHFFDGEFYPGVDLRAKVMLKSLNQPVDNVLLVVRNYSEIYTSAFTMFSQIRHRPDFSEFAPKLMGIENGWITLIDQILGASDIGKLTVVAFEKRGTDLALLKHLAPGVPTGLKSPPKHANVSASAEALAEMQKRFGEGETLTREQKDDIIATHALDKGGSKFAPFDKTQTKTLTDRYKAELDALAKRTDIKLIM